MPVMGCERERRGAGRGKYEEREREGEKMNFPRRVVKKEFIAFTMYGM